MNLDPFMLLIKYQYNSTINFKWVFLFNYFCCLKLKLQQRNIDSIKQGFDDGDDDDDKKKTYMYMSVWGNQWPR